MNARTRIISLWGCSIGLMLALGTGTFDFSRAAVAAGPPDDETAVAPDDGPDRGPMAGPRGPRHEAPPPGADDEGDDDGPPELRPPRRRGEFGHGGEDGPRRGRGPRGEPYDGDGPPRGGRGPGRGFPQPRFELTEEVVQQVMAFLEDKLPDWHARLEQLRADNPEAFRGALRRVIPLVEEYKHLQETNPELAEKVLDEFRIEHRLRELARQHIEAVGDAEAQGKIEAQIAPLVRQQLEIRWLRQEAKLNEMQKRLDKDRERLEAERADVDGAVARRMKQIKRSEFGERGREKFRRDGKDRRGLREGLRRRGPRDDGDGLEGPRRRRPPPEPEPESEDEL